VVTLDRPYVKLIGAGASKTKITFNNYAGITNEAGIRLGTNNSATVFINVDHISVEGITFENSYYQPGFDEMGRQAVAVNTSGNDVTFYNCSFLGRQDTLYVRDGSCYLEQCYIEGDVDFIFGACKAVFYQCELCSLINGYKGNGYITAASTLAFKEEGLIFINCKLTCDTDIPEKLVYLGRPWHPSSCNEPVCSKTVFINCEMGKHIKEEGWTIMGTTSPDTERYFEYGSYGLGAHQNDKRPQLKQEQVIRYHKIVERMKDDRRDESFK
jgi:pectinesterase